MTELPVDSHPIHPPYLAIIGGGTMARAICDGAIAAGVLDPTRVVVAEPDEARRGGFAVGVASAGEAIAWIIDHELAPGSAQVLLAVKPQMLSAIGEEIGGLVGDRVVLTIMAGVRGQRVRDSLGGHARIVRVMPNMPARIGMGITAIAPSAGSTPSDASFAETVFGALGPIVRLDESMMDAFTAIAGSGPAYVFYLVEAMADAAQRVGFDEQTARMLAERTVIGSAALLDQSGEGAESLREAVTSKGGTTAAAIAVLDESGVRDAIARAVEAARDRGRQLGSL